MLTISHLLHIHGVVLGVRTLKADADDAILAVDLHRKATTVAPDAEDQPDRRDPGTNSDPGVGCLHQNLLAKLAKIRPAGCKEPR